MPPPSAPNARSSGSRADDFTSIQMPPLTNKAAYRTKSERACGYAACRQRYALLIFIFRMAPSTAGRSDNSISSAFNNANRQFGFARWFSRITASAHSGGEPCSQNCVTIRGIIITERRGPSGSCSAMSMLQKGQLFHNGRNGRETKATTAPRTARSRRRRLEAISVDVHAVAV